MMNMNKLCPGVHLVHLGRAVYDVRWHILRCSPFRCCSASFLLAGTFWSENQQDGKASLPSFLFFLSARFHPLLFFLVVYDPIGCVPVVLTFVLSTKEEHGGEKGLVLSTKRLYYHANATIVVNKTPIKQCTVVSQNTTQKLLP